MVNAAATYLWVTPIVVGLFVVQYVALRIRDTRATPPDPHLGRKALLYFFFNAAVFLALVGFTVSALDWAEYLFEPIVRAQQARQNGAPRVLWPEPNPGELVAPPILAPPLAPVAPPPRDWFNDQQRLAAGLVTSGLLYGLLFWVLIRLATNDRAFPAVRRAFVGMRFFVAGCITLTLGAVSITTAFQRGEPDYKNVQQIAAVALVWGPAAALHLVLLLWSSGWRSRPAAAAD